MFGRKSFGLDPQDIVARKRAATRPLERLIERSVREQRPSQAPAHLVDLRPGARGDRPERRREIDLDAAGNDFGRQTIIDSEDEIAESVVNAELKRVAKMLARTAPEFAFDPHDADGSAAPVGGCREIVE